jgi:hypothetical protein
VQDRQLCLRIYLKEARDFAGKLPTEYCYRNVYDFVLREDRFFEPRPLPAAIRKRPIKLNAVRDQGSATLGQPYGHAGFRRNWLCKRLGV